MRRIGPVAAMISPAAIAEAVRRECIDATEEAVRQGEERAEREWALEHGLPLPHRLWSPQCRLGNHVIERTLGDIQGVCVGCHQTEEQIEAS